MPGAYPARRAINATEAPGGASEHEEEGRYRVEDNARARDEVKRRSRLARRSDSGGATDSAPSPSPALALVALSVEGKRSSSVFCVVAVTFGVGVRLALLGVLLAGVLVGGAQRRVVGVGEVLLLDVGFVWHVRGPTRGRLPRNPRGED